MSGLARRAAVPVAAGLVASLAAFAIVLSATREEARPAAAPAPAPASRDVARGRAVFASVGCGGCHRLAAAGSTGQIGPPLDQVLPNHTAASIRAQITDPRGSGVMPADFARRMSPRELDALIAFLLASR